MHQASTMLAFLCLLNTVMRIYEIEIKTPEQLRIEALKKKKDKAADTLKAEKDRQSKAKAREKILSAQQTLYNTNQ